MIIMILKWARHCSGPFLMISCRQYDIIRKKFEASVVCVGSSTARESRMKFRAGEHDHSYHIVHIAEAKGSADDEFDLVVSRLGASIRQLEPCGGNDGREVTLDFPA